MTRGVRIVPWALLGVLMSTSGCYAHVQLAVPPATAPLEARMKAYNALKPVSYAVTQTQTESGTVVSRSADFLTLSDGQEIHHPEDLLPAVAPRSACAFSVKRYLAASHAEGTAELIGYPVAVVGLGIGLYGLEVQASVPYNASYGAMQTADDQAMKLVLIGGTVAIVGALVAAAGALIWGHRANEEGETAYQTYDDGLITRLHLKGAAGVRAASKRQVPATVQVVTQPAQTHTPRTPPPTSTPTSNPMGPSMGPYDPTAPGAQ